MNPIGRYHFKVGDFACIAISDGTGTRPADSIVEDMPLDVWRQALVEHGLSPVEATASYNVLYVEAGEYRVLVDVGWGKGTQRRDGQLLDCLIAEGIAPADIDVVVITHLDADHVGGIATADGQLTYANADYVLSEDAWAFWTDEAKAARMPEDRAGAVHKTLSSIQFRLEVVPAGVEFLPGFELIAAPGHWPGHSAISIVSGDARLVHLADTVGHAILMEHPSWHWFGDAWPEQAEVDKRLILGQAAEQGALLFAPHLPFPPLGHAVPQGEGWRWEPVAE